MNRNKWIGLIVVVAIIIVGGIMFWPRPPAKIVISNWDGYMPKDLLENFTKATGIQAEVVGACHQRRDHGQARRRRRQGLRRGLRLLALRRGAGRSSA